VVENKAQSAVGAPIQPTSGGEMPPRSAGGGGRVERRPLSKRGKRVERISLVGSWADSPLAGWLRDVLVGLRTWLGQDAAQLTVHFQELQPECEDANAAADCVMAVQADVGYNLVVIYVYPMARELWSAGEYEVLVESALHEWVHVMLDPVVTWAWEGVSPNKEALFRRDLERTVEMIVWRLRRALPSAMARRWIAQAKELNSEQRDP